jgi:hypothetical protein
MVKPVNYMVKSTVQKKTGYASDKVTGLTVLGVLGGQADAKRRFRRRVFANNKRGYVRNKEVWQCCSGECHYTVTEIRQGLAKQAQQSRPQQQEEATTLEILFALAFMAGVGYGLWWVWTAIKSFFS